MSIARAHLAIKYIFFETLPSFIFGAIIFVFILLMFQALRLTEFMLVHGVDAQTVLKIMLYLVLSFTPIILPMSLLFAVLLTYGRLSADSEIVALRALGLNMRHLTTPALILSALVAIGSAHTSFFLAPWGNRQFEVLMNDLGRLKASATIREGVFSEGFFDLVIYANDVDSNLGRLKKVFIFDERNPNSPVTIIAREGEIIQEKTNVGNSALLRLLNGNIHKATTEAYTKIDFTSFDINLFDPVNFEEKRKTPTSYNLFDLRTALKDPTIEAKKRRKIEIEWHRRWALSLACILFAFLGVGFGTTTNRRSAKSGGFVVCIAIIVCYWIGYVVFEGVAKNGHLPAAIAIWIPNLFFSGVAYFMMRQASVK